MQAFASTKYTASPAQDLEEVSVAKPAAPAAFDLVVRNIAVATNPIDYKKLANLGAGLDASPDGPLIVGSDGAGVVEAVGPDCTRFKVGDEVFYAGHLKRDGSFADYTTVDSRLVGHKPQKFDFSDTSCLALVALTAWEGLVETMGISPDNKGANEGKVLLVVAGAGGVGSIAIQLGKLFGLCVVATASRPETVEWCKSMGADHVVNHHEDLQPQMEAAGVSAVDYVFDTHALGSTVPKVVGIMKPLGHITTINPEQTDKIDWNSLFFKRISVGFELMYTRELFGAEPEKQGAILDRVAQLVDQGVIKSIKGKAFPRTLDGVKQALELQMSGKACGKISLSSA